MKYLIDTHIFLWMAYDDKQISLKSHKILKDEDCEIFLSIVSIWEMSIKMSLGRLKLAVELNELIQEQASDNGISLLSIKKEHIFKLHSMPFHHRDPFDRLLICQAQSENMSILTADKVFKKYDVKCIF